MRFLSANERVKQVADDRNRREREGEVDERRVALFKIDIAALALDKMAPWTGRMDHGCRERRRKNERTE